MPVSTNEGRPNYIRLLDKVKQSKVYLLTLKTLTMFTISFTLIMLAAYVFSVQNDIQLIIIDDNIILNFKNREIKII